MIESGGRRIQRAVNIDITSIRLCDQQLLQRINKLPRFNEFLRPESSNGDNHQDDINISTLTMNLFDMPSNLSLFKKYLEGYCKSTRNSRKYDQNCQISAVH